MFREGLRALLNTEPDCQVVGEAPEDDTVVVSHGATMMSLWWHVTGEWREGRVARNAGIVVAEHRHGRWHSAAVAEVG